MAGTGAVGVNVGTFTPAATALPSRGSAGLGETASNVDASGVNLRTGQGVGQMKPMSVQEMAILEAKAIKTSMADAKLMDEFGEMCRIARNLVTGKDAQRYFKFVARVHPLVKGGQTAYGSVNEFISAIYGMPVPDKTTDDATRRQWERYRSHFNTAKDNGRELLGFAEVKDATKVSTPDPDKVAARFIKTLSDMSLEHAVKVSNMVADAVQQRQTVARRVARVAAENDAKRKLAAARRASARRAASNSPTESDAGGALAAAGTNGQG